MRNIDTYIKDNHRERTLSEMAIELGETAGVVNGVLKRLGLFAITKSERCKEYIKAHPEMPKKVLLKTLNISRGVLRKYAKELGIPLLKKPVKTPVVIAPPKKVYLSPKEEAGIIKIVADMIEPWDIEERKAFAKKWTNVEV